MLTNNCMDNNTNKVYINPNFNRTSGNIPSSSVMHINPRFSRLLPNENFQNKAKIYVNPYFVKPTKSSDSLKSTEKSNINCNPKAIINPSSSYQSGVPETAVPFAKSRYSLVRHNTTKLMNSDIGKSKNTFQVNKYKSILLKDVKMNLEYSKISESKQSLISTNAVSVSKKYSLSSSTSTAQYKLVNHQNLKPVVRNDNIKIKTPIDTNQIKFQKSKGNLKKNNIPCPTFQKFGKCLRKTHGICDFLHDKKHVSVCRKFIKGLCHDKDCLLSHDLTTKKMPTCYFYLKGVCTNTDCPYLHVKLSAKAKICPDFLKGYCEKGSRCLQRHININSGKKTKASAIKSLLHLKKNDKRVKDNILTHNNSENKVHSTDDIKTENGSDCRYYQEQQDLITGDKCEIIKPTRCKLGTLPSFIQL